MRLFKELKRRNVFRVAIAYMVMAWLLVQVLGIATESFEAPVWVMKLVITLTVVGFVPTLLFSWAFELTPEGLKKESELDKNFQKDLHTAKKLDYITILAAVAVLLVFAWQQLGSNDLDSLHQSNDSIELENVELDNIEVQETVIPEVNNKSIAVLPFSNMANDPENEPFTLGIHDDLLTHISKISALKVISRTSVMEYKDTTKKIKQIAEELDVANILEGGVQRAGNQIRINVQLIDAQTDEHLWAEKFDRELTASNIFKVQTEISIKIAVALKAQLTSEEQSSLAKQDTDNLEAYSAYLAGRQMILNRKAADIKQAQKLFQSARELDPQYVQAYVGEALTWNLLHEYSDITYKQKYEIGEPLIDKALSMNPSLAYAHAVKGGYLKGKELFVEAEASYQKAINLNPNEASAYHWYAHMLRNYLSRPEDSLIQIRKAAELSPMSPTIQANVGWSLLALNRTDEAFEQFKFLYDFAPDYQGGPEGFSVIYLMKGNFDMAIKWLKEAIDRNKGNVGQYEYLAYLYLNLQTVEEAKQVVDDIKIRFPDSINHKTLSIFIALFEGQHERSIELAKQYAAIESDRPNAHFFEWSMAYYSRNYRYARDLLLPQLLSDTGQWVELESSNNIHFIALSWCLLQLSETKQAQSIIDHIGTSQLDWKNKESLKALYLGIQGKHAEAAEMFGHMVENMDVENWWIFLKNPMFDEMKKLSSYQQSYKKLMDELEKQRKKLINVESLEEVK